MTHLQQPSPVDLNDCLFVRDLTGQLFPDSIAERIHDDENLSAEHTGHGRAPIVAVTFMGHHNRPIHLEVGGQMVSTEPVAIGVQGTVILGLDQLAAFGAHLGRIIGSLPRHWQDAYKRKLGVAYSAIIGVPLFVNHAEDEIDKLTPDDFADPAPETGPTVERQPDGSLPQPEPVAETAD